MASNTFEDISDRYSSYSQLTDTSVNLTIHKQCKIEELCENAQREPKTALYLLSIFKWMLSFILCGAVLVSSVASKLSVIELARVTCGSGFNATEETSLKASILLVWSLMVPSTWTFLLACYQGILMRHNTAKLSKKMVAWALLSSAFESGGLCLLVFLLIGHQPNYILFMNGVFIAPSMEQFFKSAWKSWVEYRNTRLCSNKVIKATMFFFSTCCTLTGIILVIVNGLNEKYIWALPLALCCISVAWSPLFSHLLLGKSMSHMENDEMSTAYTKEQKSNRTLRIKVTIISSLCKLILIPAFSTFFIFIENLHSIKDVWKNSFEVFELSVTENIMLVFILNVVSSFLAFYLARLACQTCMQRLSFAVPLLLVTPCIAVFLWTSVGKEILSYVYFHLERLDVGRGDICSVLAVSFLWVAQVICAGYFILNDQTIVMEMEDKLFWYPSYNGVLLNEWLLLNRKTKESGDTRDDAITRKKRPRIYICTTMYRETEHEMEQLLRSLADVNNGIGEDNDEPYFESHVFLDGGVKGTKLSLFALQLISLLNKTLDTDPQNTTKVSTPYGMSLAWYLPNRKMTLTIHLKDNMKVKNKKRWSQIMYMSYVIDYASKRALGQVADTDTYILTTDADVRFTAESVQTLLDIIVRDSSVGAVCARTHPLGSGPVVWYQIFDYAIGHWFQKVANHVLGSVLCCPGCFTVYRMTAIKDVLPKYASTVEKASEFLTKDMGEDRWLCTLMVQSGWSLEYCAAADNSTYCPEEFEEFFKQRRRWIPSTLANILLLLQDSRTALKFNDKITTLFLLYQVFLLFSTLISPATVILVTAGGLFYGWCIPISVTLILMSITTIVYAIICLTTTQETQLQVAKCLTFLGSIVMLVVTVGIASQVIENASSATSNHTKCGIEMVPDSLTLQYGMSTSTLYIAGVCGLYVAAGLLHIQEIMCLVHGVCYFICLPAGYLVLMVYSLCNITDQSWGTREDTSTKTEAKTYWKQRLKSFMEICTCCTSCTSKSQEMHSVVESFEFIQEDTTTSNHEQVEDQIQVQMAGYSVGMWLDEIDDTFKELYAEKLISQGYESTQFIWSITDEFLQTIGVTLKEHRKKILTNELKLEKPTLDPLLANGIRYWLHNLGLHMYIRNFKDCKLANRDDLKSMKIMSANEMQQYIRDELHIRKQGHVKMLHMAIKNIRPTSFEGRLKTAQGQLNAANELHELSDIDKELFDFWSQLIRDCIKPEGSGHDEGLKKKLEELRNSTVMVFGMVNILWMVLIYTLGTKAELTVLGTNPIDIVFLVLFGGIMVVQFMCMLFHRLASWMHMIARAPYRCGRKCCRTQHQHEDDTHEREVVNEQNRAIKHRLRTRNSDACGETDPLLNNEI